MRIRTKFRIVAVLAVFLAAFMAAVLFCAFKRVDSNISRIRHTDRILNSVFGLKVVTQDYCDSGLARASVQWQAAHASLLQELDSLAIKTEEQRFLLRRMRDSHSALTSTFSQLRGVVEGTGSGAAIDAGTMRRRLVAKVDAGLLTMLSDANRLLGAIYRDTESFQTAATAAVALSSITMLGLVLGLAVMISRSALRPLTKLQEDTAIVGSGNLDHRTGILSRDEIGQLSRAFDNMIERLKRVTASRDHLDREVAQRQRAERHLRETLENLERSNKDLEQFAYSASHDLQEPLRKVSAFGSLLENEYAPQLEGDGQQYIASMVNAAQRMQSLINDLLAYSRVTTRGKAFATVDLSDTVEGVLSDLETRIHETGAVVEVRELPVIEADPTQMRQLMQNLIGNALKFHREGEHPEVRVYAEEQPGPSGEADPTVEIVVEDQGIGFDEKYADRIFGVFQRLHQRHRYAGSGIGLAVCRRIAERHGGTITASSKQGEGATFRVRLPKTQARRETEE